MIEIVLHDNGEVSIKDEEKTIIYHKPKIIDNRKKRTPKKEKIVNKIRTRKKPKKKTRKEKSYDNVARFVIDRIEKARKQELKKLGRPGYIKPKKYKGLTRAAAVPVIKQLHKTEGYSLFKIRVLLSWAMQHPKWSKKIYTVTGLRRKNNDGTILLDEIRYDYEQTQNYRKARGPFRDTSDTVPNMRIDYKPPKGKYVPDELTKTTKRAIRIVKSAQRKAKSEQEGIPIEDVHIHYGFNLKLCKKVIQGLHVFEGFTYDEILDALEYAMQEKKWIAKVKRLATDLYDPIPFPAVLMFSNFHLIRKEFCEKKGLEYNPKREPVFQEEAV